MIRLTNNWEELLARLPTDARVLDVGGAFRPLGRADYMLDIQPHRKYSVSETRDGVSPHFSKATWTQRDVCDAEPWPFEDKSMDFIFCSHLLEDVRDPLGVCRELSRIGKAGYVEFPSREFESTRGIELRWELPRQAGCYHHRWLCEVAEDVVVFMNKPAFMHGSNLYSFPRSYLKKWTDEKRLTLGLAWEGALPARERIILDFREFQAEMRRFIVERSGYNLGMWWHDAVFSRAKKLVLWAVRGT